VTDCGHCDCYLSVVKGSERSERVEGLVLLGPVGHIVSKVSKFDMLVMDVT
jgi:hypothetical protein